MNKLKTKAGKLLTKILNTPVALGIMPRGFKLAEKSKPCQKCGIICNSLNSKEIYEHYQIRCPT